MKIRNKKKYTVSLGQVENAVKLLLSKINPPTTRLWTYGFHDNFSKEKLNILVSKNRSSKHYGYGDIRRDIIKGLFRQ